MPKRSIFHDGDSPKVNTKHARVELSAGQKREICRYKMEHSQYSYSITHTVQSDLLKFVNVEKC